MKLMPLSILAIYFVVASTGYLNQLDTTKVDNVEDRGNHYKKSCFCYSVILKVKIDADLDLISSYLSMQNKWWK